MISRLGGGSFADVYKAREKSTGDLVAIKVLKRKYNKAESCMNLRECKSLQKLNDDANGNQPGKDSIIKLKQIIFIKKTGTLNLIFEFMERDLFELMKSKEPNHLSENEIRDIMFQTLQGITYMHKYGFFHRDLKPENLLLVGDKVKIADFGLAREIRTFPPFTEYVSTRYYRAPECILKSQNYNSPIDIWAMGAIMAEMYLHPQPLFYGANEKQVLFKIASILGPPTHEDWPKGVSQAKALGIKFPSGTGTPLEKIIPDASPEAIDLMNKMLKWCPDKRAKAHELLNHPFFSDYGSSLPTLQNETDIGLNIGINVSNIKKFSNKKEVIIKNPDDFLNTGMTVSKKSEKSDSDDNNFSKMLNDTDGFDKFLNQLKKDQIENDRNFEKEKKNFFGNEFEISNIQTNNINDYSLTGNNNIFTQSMKENKLDKMKFSNITPLNKDKDDEFDYKDPGKFYKNSKNLDSINLGNSFDKNDDIFNVGFDNTNNSNSGKNSPNSNENFQFDNAVDLKPDLNFSNRRRSARKFLEETEGKYSGSGSGSTGSGSPGNNNNVPFQYNNNDFNSIGNTSGGHRPVIIKNRREAGNFNMLLENKDNNMQIGEGTFNRRENTRPIESIENKEFKHSDSLFGMGSRRNHMSSANFQV